MKKIIVGVKENDKMIFIQTVEVRDTFETSQLAKAVQSVTKVFLDREK